MNDIMLEKIKKDISASIECEIIVLRIIFKEKMSKNEFVNTLKEQLGSEFCNQINELNLSDEEICYMFFEISKNICYSSEEIQSIKEKILNNEIKYNKKCIISSLNIEEITYENLSIIFNRNLSEIEINKLQELKNKNSISLDTLKLEFFTEENIKLFENNFERILMYSYLQDNIKAILENPIKKDLFIKILNYYNNCDSTKIEKICNNIIAMDSNKISLFYGLDSSYTPEAILLSMDKDIANIVNNKDDLDNLESIINDKVEESIYNSNDLEKIKNSILIKYYKLNLNDAKKLDTTYGNDINNLFKEEQNKYVEAMVNISKIVNCDDINELRKITNVLQVTDSIEIRIKLEEEVKKAYNHSIVKSIDSSKQKEKIIEENLKDGYRIISIDGKFSKVVSVINAFGDDTNKQSIVERLHGQQSMLNHASCYSLYTDMNPGIVASGKDKHAVIISIDNFDPSSITVISNSDCATSNMTNITNSSNVKYYTGSNLPNVTRDGYSEIDVENFYNGKRTEVTSLLCYGKVNEETIEAAKELSKEYGRIINIEVVDEQKLIEHSLEYIKNEMLAFNATKDPQHLINYITQNLNFASAFSEKNKDSEFNDLRNKGYHEEEIRNFIFSALNQLKYNADAIKLVRDYIMYERKSSPRITTIITMEEFNEFVNTNEVEKIADKMIEAMVNGTLDVDGNFINNDSIIFQGKTLGFGYLKLLGFISWISSLLILTIGLIIFYSK